MSCCGRAAHGAAAHRARAKCSRRARARGRGPVCAVPCDFAITPCSSLWPSPSPCPSWPRSSASTACGSWIPAGNDWYWWPLELGRFLPYAAGHLSLSMLLAVGDLLQIARGRAGVESRLVLLFLTLALSLVLYGLLSQWAAAGGCAC